MSNDYDISMSLNDTLELDTIIKESSKASEPISITYDGSSSYNSNILNGIQTHTSIFNPPEPGVFNFNINGQELKIEVTDPSDLPSNIIEDFEDNSNIVETYDSWQFQNSNGSATITSSSISGNYSLKIKVDGGNGTVIKADRTDGGWKPATFQYDVKLTNSPSGSESCQLRFTDSSRNLVGGVHWNSGGEMVNTINPSKTLISDSLDKTYRVVLYFDWDNNTVDTELWDISNSKKIIEDLNKTFSGSNVARIDSGGDSDGGVLEMVCDNFGWSA